jgi:hypothetical protein
VHRAGVFGPRRTTFAKYGGRSVTALETGNPKLETASRVNVVNVGERYKSVTFITYPYESKGPVNVVNVAQGYFAISRTFDAKCRRGRRR